jgi:hypothetical protein
MTTPAPNLLDFQRRVAGAVMSPLDASVSAVARLLVKPNDRLTSTDRLNIYHGQYWYRILDSFSEDFPGLRAILGERAFGRLSRAYLKDCPSQSFTLRNLGSRLEGWLQENPEFAGKNAALALDMARLEWAHMEAFDNAERKALGPEDLLELGPELIFALQPHIGLLELQYPVDELRIKVSGHSEAQRVRRAPPNGTETASRRTPFCACSSEEHGRASNAVNAPVRRHTVRRNARLRPQRIFLAVHRVEFTVYYRRLERQEFRLLKALGHGRPIGAALDALADSPIDPAELQQKIQTWFANWSQLGWLYRAAPTH